MNLVDRATSAFSNSVPASGSPAEKRAIDAACNAGFNASPDASIPAQFDDFPLLREWFSIGLKARVNTCHVDTSDGFGFGR